MLFTVSLANRDRLSLVERVDGSHFVIRVPMWDSRNWGRRQPTSEDVYPYISDVIAPSLSLQRFVDGAEATDRIEEMSSWFSAQVDELSSENSSLREALERVMDAFDDPKSAARIASDALGDW